MCPEPQTMNFRADVELLAEEGLIYKLEHPEKKATLLFPRHRWW
jgi:hypothetical protein